MRSFYRALLPGLLSLGVERDCTTDFLHWKLLSYEGLGELPEAEWDRGFQTMRTRVRNCRMIEYIVQFDPEFAWDSG